MSAVAEGGLALFLVILVTNFVSAQLGELVPEGKSAPYREHMFGAARVFVTILVVAFVYGPRFRPGHTAGQAASSVLASFPPVLLRVRLSPASLLLLGFHLSQVWWVLSTEGWSLSDPRFLRCADWTSVFWAPVFEEVLFRVAVLYVILHRSHGNAIFAILGSATIFAAIHVPNVLSGTVSQYALTQMVVAILVGSVYSLLFAGGGSLLEVTLLHIANNLAAVAWMSRDDHIAIAQHSTSSGSSGSSGSLPEGFKSCQAQVSTQLLLALNLLLVAYTAAGFLAWRHLSALIAPIAADSADAGAVVGKFRRLHPIVYGDSPPPVAAIAEERSKTQ